MRRSLATTAIAAVLVIAACGSGTPPLLPLSAAGSTKEAAGGAADMSMRVANNRYELVDGVKADKDKQDAYKFALATRADAARVAKAFGVKGDLRADESGWSAGADGREPATDTNENSLSLYVGKNGSFSVSGNYAVSSSPGCIEPDAREAAADGDVAPCPSTTTTIPPNTPSKAEARKAAEDALRAAGIDLDDTKVMVTTHDNTVEVRFQPAFGGASVEGVEHAVAVGPEKAIAYASGYLGDAKTVGSYDLATLQRAVDRLNASMIYAGGTDDRALAAQAIEPAFDVAVEPEPAPDNSEPTVVNLTGVEVGLMMTIDDADGSLWLTPAYFFDTEEQGTVTAAAADDKYLPPPTTAPPAVGDADAPVDTDVPPANGSGGSAGSGGGASGSSGGSAGSPPANPPPSPPAESSNCTSTSEPIAAKVCSDRATYEAGDTVVFTITAADPDRAFTEGPCGDGVNVEYGDDGEGDVRCLACSTTVADGPGKISRSRKHTYSKAGTYTTTFTIKSGSECGDPHPNDSTVTLSLKVPVA